MLVTLLILYVDGFLSDEKYLTIKLLAAYSHLWHQQLRVSEVLPTNWFDDFRCHHVDSWPTDQGDMPGTLQLSNASSCFSGEAKAPKTASGQVWIESEVACLGRLWGFVTSLLVYQSHYQSHFVPPYIWHRLVCRNAKERPENNEFFMKLINLLIIEVVKSNRGSQLHENNTDKN